MLRVDAYPGRAISHPIPARLAAGTSGRCACFKTWRCFRPGVLGHEAPLFLASVLRDDRITAMIEPGDQPVRHGVIRAGHHRECGVFRRGAAKKIERRQARISKKSGLARSASPTFRTYQLMVFGMQGGAL